MPNVVYKASLFGLPVFAFLIGAVTILELRRSRSKAPPALWIAAFGACLFAALALANIPSGYGVYKGRLFGTQSVHILLASNISLLVTLFAYAWAALSALLVPSAKKSLVMSCMLGVGIFVALYLTDWVTGSAILS